MKVLTVDDSPLIQTRLTELLEEVDGITDVHQAFTVAEALERLDAYQPEVVILDLKLPDGNGMDVLKTLQKQPSPPIVVVLSGLIYPQYEDTCLELGADYFLDKMNGFDCIPHVLEHIQQNL